MRQATKDEFYGAIFAGKLDVHPRIVSAFPYTSHWVFQRKLGEPLFGKSIDRLEGGMITTDYFLAVAA